jgi:hypothetical protein
MTTTAAATRASVCLFFILYGTRVREQQSDGENRRHYRRGGQKLPDPKGVEQPIAP